MEGPIDSILEGCRKGRLLLLQGAGDPVVHDFRVGLRRLMTWLRLGRDFWGRRKVKSLLQGFKKIFDATSPFQDEIVFQQIYLKAFQAVGEGFWGQEWLKRREKRLTQLKESAKAALTPPFFTRLLSQTEQLLKTIGQDHAPLKLRKAFKQAFQKELKKLRRLLKAHQDKPQKEVILHKLRIESKRIRYSLEGFDFLIRRRHRKLLLLSERIQKTLGDWRDRQASLKKLPQQASIPPKIRALLKKELLDQEQDESEMAGKALERLAKAKIINFRIRSS